METPTAPLDDETIRRSLIEGIRDHLIQRFGLALPDVADAESLRELGRTAGGAVADLETRVGARFEPPYPGLAEPPEAMGANWRMICAARVHVGARVIGTLMTTFVSGRRPSVVFAPPDSLIPAPYVPLLRR